MSTQADIEKVKRLIEKGRQVLATHRPPPPNVVGFPTLDSGAFSAWRTQCLNFLDTRLGPSNAYAQTFREQIEQGYKEDAKSGIGILESVKEDWESGDLIGTTPSQNPVEIIRILCDRFHTVCRQLRSRHNDRSTLDVQDEYDVQDLLHCLLSIYFSDIRPEEWTPSYAGKSSRMDFLLKQEQVVVETKKTRNGLGARELGTQLIEDIARYEAHPDCEMLVCFIYDPDGRIANPRGIENDLRRSEGKPRVEVLIKP